MDMLSARDWHAVRKTEALAFLIGRFAPVTCLSGSAGHRDFV